MQNALTVDVEEWFHVCGAGDRFAPDHWDGLPARVVETTRDLLDLFDACGVRATFFVLGWVAIRHPPLVNEILRAGHEVGSHGHWHRRIYELSPEAFVADLEASRSALAAAGAPLIRGYRAPEWSINDRSLWALEILAGAGMRFDSSMAPLRIVGDPSYPKRPHPRATPHGQVLEFPPLVDRRFGQEMPLGVGWGLRMSKPIRVLRVIDERNRQGCPIALAVHPWEIDPDPPRAPMPLAKRFAHYFRLDGFRARLEDIIRGASFAPMGEVLGLDGSSP